MLPWVIRKDQGLRKQLKHAESSHHHTVPQRECPMMRLALPALGVVLLTNRTVRTARAPAKQPPAATRGFFRSMLAGPCILAPMYPLCINIPTMSFVVLHT